MARLSEAMIGPAPVKGRDGTVLALVWEFPILRPHCGIPLGNSNLGAMVWGKDPDRLCVTVSRSDFWDHRAGEILAEGNTYARLKKAQDPKNPVKMERAFLHDPQPPGGAHPTRLPGGRFECQLARGLRLKSAALIFGSGHAVVTVSDKAGSRTHELHLVASPSDVVLCVHDPDSVIQAVQARPAWEWTGKVMAARGFQPPKRIQKGRAIGWVQECPADPALAAITMKAGSAHWVALGRGNSGAAAVETVLVEVTHMSTRGVKELRRRSDQWWQAYWERAPTLDVPSDFHNAFFRYAQYRFACATNPATRVPAGLQGPWIEEYQMPPWAADYHFNVNIQEVYTLGLANNTPEHLLPLFAMVDSWRDAMRHTARVVTGDEDGLMLSHASDDRGYCTEFWGPWGVLDPAGMGWTAQLYWLYYRYTGDINFLRRRAWPMLKGAMRVYERMLEKDGARYALPIGVSPEYYAPAVSGQAGRRQRVGRNPAFQLACIHMLLDALLEAAQVLGETPPPLWKTLKRKTPKFPLIKEKGKERIGIWEGQDLAESHPHCSHLAAIYPFDSLGAMTPEIRRIVQNTMARWMFIGTSEWSEWSFPWAAIIAARLGYRERPMVLMDYWRTLALNEGWSTVYPTRFSGLTQDLPQARRRPLDESEIMQLDGTMGAATALIEMLAHTHSGITRIFPAIPAAWRDVAFSGVRIPGPFLVGATLRAGRVMDITVQALADGTLRLDVPGMARLLLRRKGKLQSFVLPGTLKLRKNEKVHFRQG